MMLCDRLLGAGDRNGKLEASGALEMHDLDAKVAQIVQSERDATA